ncbi:acetyl-CoA carboxylase biotin carboxyl carrier protein, partial [candidate division KSB1 bacterium]|nr:acetyl-CoA carboxylase biotin carboxyl carrier protein [candidate division KSB1 bacterium]
STHIIADHGADLPVQKETSTFILPEPSVQVQEQVSLQDETTEDNNWIDIRSPMVGTCYRAPAPDQPPYVEVGDVVAPGQVVCLIEAMKLMNEIQAEVGGRVTDISVENGQPVEYNQVLFRLESQ